MAVQAQYPSNVLLLNRNLQDSNKASNYSIQQQTGAYLDQIHFQPSPTMFFNNNNNGGATAAAAAEGINPRKRRRDTSSGITTTAPGDSFSGFLPQLSPQQPLIVDLTQLQNNNNNSNNNHNLQVSTGLKLSFPDSQYQNQYHHNHHQSPPQMNPNSSPPFSPFLSVAHQINQQGHEIDQLLQAQAEELRRALVEKRQRHYRSLISAAEEWILHRLKENQAEVEKVLKRNAELEARAAQLSIEAQVWQAKSRAQEAAAASLQAQLQQAIINGGRRIGSDGVEEGTAEDAESVYIDPDRVVAAEVEVDRYGPVCKVCRQRPASVVALPCRHLCLCAACDGAVEACPYCFTMKNSSVEVFLT